MGRWFRIVLAGVAALGIGASGLLWSWTRTPHGPMDLGAAIVIRTMPGGPLEMTPERRADANAWVGRFFPAPPTSVEISDAEFPAPGGPQPARVYRPASARDGGDPVGVVVWIHGGGYWMGDELAMWDGPCASLAEKADAVVVSIGYRLAPEHPFPAAVEDSWAGFLWTHANAASWGGDPERLAVMGGSAGGNLAAVVALRARDEQGPRIARQVLTVPTLNAGGEPTESMRAFAAGFGLNGLDQMRAAYFREPGDVLHRWATPLLVEDLSGLAPAVIHTAQFDPLRDEGEAYAERLRAAGVPVEVHRFEGAIHGFLGSSAAREESERRTVAALRRALGPATATGSLP